MKPKFETTEDGLEVIDRIERHRYRLTTHEPVSPQPVATDQIQYPVDTATEITASVMTIPVNTGIYIRNRHGEVIHEYVPSEQLTLSEEEYTLDLSGSLKLYINIQSPIFIYSDTEYTYITFDESTCVTVGARSYHTRPAGTITTTGKPEDLMKAVSAFGSALKTTTAERSYPTLRGHPPTIKIGDELAIPSRFERPKTGIQIQVPPTLRHVLVIPTLSYYLGAKVVSGSDAKIITDNGYTFNLGSGKEYEKSVGKILKIIFFLDCILRTEGTTPLPLRERQKVEELLDFDIEKTYDQTLSEQIETYLETPFDLIEQHIPSWDLESQLKPIEESAKFIPFLVNNFANISISENSTPQRSIPDQKHTKAIDDFTRGSFSQRSGSIRGEEDITEDIRAGPQTIRQVWTTSFSEIVSTTPISAFYNNIGRNPKENPIEIEVVCNDPNMDEELETVNEVYKNQDELPFDVTVHHNLTMAGLESIVTKESDFLHYIGHIDKDGFQCSDGKLNASDIKNVGALAFLLNACQSYDQGLHLVEAGSIGGIVTFGDVINSGAIRVGSNIANLLNKGFPLYAALDITRRDTIVGEQYRIVGDGTTTISQTKSGAPTSCVVEEIGDEIKIRIKMYSSTERRKGSIFKPHLEPVDSYYLLPGETDQIPVTRSQLSKFFDIEDLPVLANGILSWSDQIDPDEL